MSPSSPHPQSAWNLAKPPPWPADQSFFRMEAPYAFSLAGPNFPIAPQPLQAPSGTWSWLSHHSPVIPSGLGPCSSLCLQDFLPPKSLPRKLTFSSQQTPASPPLGSHPWGSRQNPLYPQPSHALCCWLVRAFLLHWTMRPLKTKVLICLKLLVQELTDFLSSY